MAHEETHRDRAMQALDDARDGLGMNAEGLENAKLYALIGIGEAAMSVYDILIDVRDRIESVERRIRDTQ